MDSQDYKEILVQSQRPKHNKDSIRKDAEIEAVIGDVLISGRLLKR
jgi:hypothetical protein